MGTRTYRDDDGCLVTERDDFSIQLPFRGRIRQWNSPEFLAVVRRLKRLERERARKSPLTLARAAPRAPRARREPPRRAVGQRVESATGSDDPPPAGAREKSRSSAACRSPAYRVQVVTGPPVPGSDHAMVARAVLEWILGAGG